MQPIRKAVIPVAGLGTRFLPATKAQPKEMLPIVDKPIVQYLVEEAAASAIKDIIFVTRRGSRAVENHFDSDFELENQLAKDKKNKQLKLIRKIVQTANFIYTRQKKSLPYGNGTPVLCVKNLVKDEPFVYVFGDDLVKSKTPCIKQLIEVYEKNPGVAAVVAVQKMPRQVLHKYGIVKLSQGGVKNQIESIIEKPTLGKAPSNLAVLGRFILTPQVVKTLAKIPTGKDHELWLVDALNKLAKTNLVIAHPIEGNWLTTGDPINYLKTTIEFTLARPDLKKDFLKLLKKYQK